MATSGGCASGERYGGRRGRAPCRRVERQVDAQHGARRTGGRVDEADGAAVQGGDPAGDGQAQAGAAGGRAAGIVGQGAEALEGPLAVGGRHSRAVVGDLEAPAVAVEPGVDPDRAALGTVAHGVVEQVDHQLAQPGPVGPDGQPVGDVDGEADGAAGRHQLGHRLVQQLGDVDLGQPQRRDPGVDARELEQVADQVGEPAGLPDRGFEVLLVGGHHAVGEVLEHGGQPGQRGAQLVGHGGDEGALLLVDRVELGGHLVERPGQLADLVGRLGADPAAVVAVGHPSRGLGHLPQRRGHARRPAAASRRAPARP